MEKVSFFRKYKILIAVIVFAVIPMLLIAALGEYRVIRRDTMLLSARIDGTSYEIRPFFDNIDGIIYFFLPMFFELDEATFLISSGNRLYLDGERIKNGAAMSGFKIDEEYDARFSSMLVPSNHKLVFVKSNGLPTIFVETESKALMEIHRDKTHKERGSIQIVSPSGKTEYRGELSYIKGRGNSTWGYEKKPYDIELSAPADLLNMGADTSWCLLANFVDYSYIRNKIVLDAAAEVGLEFTPKSEFADLFINGEYTGLYQLTGSTTGSSNLAIIGNLEAQTQELNSAVLSKFPREPFRQGENMYSHIPNNPADITGGYILEHEFLARMEQVSSGFFTDRLTPIAIASPKYASREQVEYIKGFVMEAEDALFSEDGINNETGKNYTQYFDLESWVRKFLIEECFLNVDAGISSSFFYKYKDEKSDLLYAGPAWDYDLTMGSGHFINTKNPDALIAIHSDRHKEHGETHLWFHELYKKDGFYSRMTEEYEHVMLPVLRDITENKIDLYADLIAGAARPDYLRWKHAVVYYGERTETGYAAAIDEIKKFLNDRIDFLSDIWINGETYHTVRFVTENSEEIFHSVRNGEGLERYTGMYGGGWLNADTGKPFDMGMPVTGNVDLMSAVQGPSPPLIILESRRTIGYAEVFPIVFIIFALCAFVFAEHSGRTKKQSGGVGAWSNSSHSDMS